MSITFVLRPATALSRTSSRTQCGYAGQPQGEFAVPIKPNTMAVKGSTPLLPHEDFDSASTYSPDFAPKPVPRAVRDAPFADSRSGAATMNCHRPLATCSAFAAALLLATAAAAERQSFTADYSVTLYGLPVANGTFTSTFVTDGTVSVEGSMRSAGLARLFDSTGGNTAVAARIGSNGLEPSAFRAEYTSGRRQNAVSVRFSQGDVAAVDYRHAPRERRASWVPVTDSHLRAVTDPLTALLIRASSPAEVCNRTVSGFDGWMRANLRLQTVSTGPLQGHQGTGAVCTGSFEPVAGYYADSRDVRYMRDRSDIRITFAPLGNTGVYAPISASATTRIGTLHITAGPIRRN
jgi:hypothetical protein